MPPHAADLVELIVHEMRTPITVAMGSLKQVRMLADPAEQAAVDRAIRSCTRLERLAAELRDWARLKDARPAPVPHRLRDLLRDATAAAALGSAAATILELDDVPDVVVTALPGLPDALRGLVDAILRAAEPGETPRGAIAVEDGTVVVTLYRPGCPPADRTAPFDAELLSGMGFALPLAAATIEAGGGRIASRRDGDGRLEAVTVQLASAAPSR